MATGQQYGSYILGGLFIGIWLYLALWTTPATPGLDVGAWVMFGLVGLVLAGGLFAARVTSGTARIAIFVGIGIAIAMLAMALIFNQFGEGVAALFTFVGAALVVTALPTERNTPAGAPAR